MVVTPTHGLLMFVVVALLLQLRVALAHRAQVAVAEVLLLVQVHMFGKAVLIGPRVRVVLFTSVLQVEDKVIAEQTPSRVDTHVQTAVVARR